MALFFVFYFSQYAAVSFIFRARLYQLIDTSFPIEHYVLRSKIYGGLITGWIMQAHESLCKGETTKSRLYTFEYFTWVFGLIIMCVGVLAGSISIAGRYTDLLHPMRFAFCFLHIATAIFFATFAIAQYKILKD
jgi:hypothetical protein